MKIIIQNPDDKMVEELFDIEKEYPNEITTICTEASASGADPIATTIVNTILEAVIKAVTTAIVNYLIKVIERAANNEKRIRIIKERNDKAGENLYSVKAIDAETKREIMTIHDIPEEMVLTIIQRLRRVAGRFLLND